MVSLRRLAERAGRGRVFRRRIAVAGKKVRLFVTPDAQLKYLKPGRNAFDADLIRIAERLVQPGMVVWDIGANIGVFTFAAAARGADTVLAVEADPWLAGLVRRSATLRGNREYDIRVLGSAVSNRDGVAEFLIARRGRASNALATAGGRSQMGGVRETVLVPTLSLDRIVETQPPPDFVKIDVEGAEADVLAGAATLLRTGRPVIYAEIGPEQFRTCSAILGEAEYALFNAAAKPTASANEGNYFCLPREKSKALERLK